MRQYKTLVSEVLAFGESRGDRTGTGTRSLFGRTLAHDMATGFPLLTTKKVNFASVVKELLWFLRGETNTKTLGCGIWDEWAAPDGDLGPIYGKQWRAWEGEDSDGCYGSADQITEALRQIKETPESRRIIVSAWNVLDIPRMALPPCHLLFQFYVSRRGELDLQVYQRSADLALGVPFNLASYALLLSMFANECGLEPGTLRLVFGDVHVYQNHLKGVRTQLARQARPLPRLTLPKGTPVLQIQESDIVLEGYDPHPAIRFPIAV